MSAAALGRRQLDALQSVVPDGSIGRNRRIRAATVDALAILDRLSLRADWLLPLVEDLSRLAAEDSRYRFLNAIPDGPVLALSRAVALEEALFGSRSDAVAELALQMGMFTLLLDGLLDEVPADLAIASKWLRYAMNPQQWGGSGIEEFRCRELPVTDALCWLTKSIVDTVSASRGWRDEVVREQFSSATVSAFAAELHSVALATMGDGPPPDDLRDSILAKSTAPIWAGALIPACEHGWPTGIDPFAFEGLARSIGAFGGWIDDVVDVAEDLHAGRWSLVTLEIYLGIGPRSANELGRDSRSVVAKALCSTMVHARIASIGAEQLKHISQSLTILGSDTSGVLLALSDMADACLFDSKRAA